MSTAWTLKYAQEVTASENVKPNSFDVFVVEAIHLGVPGHIVDGLYYWIVRAVPTGSFLQAVLENDLRNAVGRGDEKSLEGLVALVKFLYNSAPIGSWGSVEVCAAWREKGGLGGIFDAEGAGDPRRI